MRALILVTAIFASAAQAQALEPYQQRALDTIVATFEPEMRPMMRTQFAAILAGMDERTVAAFVTGFTQGGEDEEDSPPSWDDAEGEPSPAVVAYNRSQYEPVIRSAWAARQSFDAFVRTRLEQACAPAGRFAVFGQGWRFEVYPFRPQWPSTNGDADMAVEILGSSYGQKPGRARYDFSALRYEFDRNAVGDAITSACADYNRIGEAFLSEARRRVTDADLSQGERIAADANARVQPVNERLERLLQAQMPADDVTLFGAMINATPLD